MNTPIKKTLEVWHCTDSRLPLKTARPVGNKSLNTLRGEFVDAKGIPFEDQELAREEGTGTLRDGLQLQPIGVIKRKKEYIFVWGNGRLQRIRDFFEEGFHTGSVDVLVMEGVDPDDRATLALIENAQRSPNKLNDFNMMQELRKHNPMISYTEIYNQTGLPVGTQKQLDNKYRKVPVWAKNAMLRGEITETVAVAVGSMGDDTQKQMKALFKEQGYLTGATVKETKQVVQREAYGVMAATLFTDTQQATKEWFSREELCALVEQMETDGDRLLLENLLNS